MANEFLHKTVGADLTQAEWELSDGTSHQFNAQAAGDMLYASSTTVLRRLAIATGVVGVAAGIPAWTMEPALTSIALGTNPAAAGAVRIPNAVNISARNAANSADIPIVQVTAGNVIQISPNGYDMQFSGAAGASIGFFNVTPVTKRAGIINADGTLADITTKFNTLLQHMEDLGFQSIA